MGNVGMNKKALVIFVPYRLRREFQKLQIRLTRELSKKFGSKDILFVGERVVLPRSYVRKKGNQQRPRTRTLTEVQKGILEDICYPTSIVGKRTRITQDGKRILKVYLNPNCKKECEEKCDTFTAVYKTLCNKMAEFIFPIK